MITTISSKGQVVIPRPICERHGYRPGDDFQLLELSNGDIVLRPFHAPQKSLVWHLRQLRGLKIPRRREYYRKTMNPSACSLRSQN